MKTTIAAKQPDRKPRILTSQNSPELAQRIKEASTQILKRNYQLYKDLEDK